MPGLVAFLAFVAGGIAAFAVNMRMWPLQAKALDALNHTHAALNATMQQRVDAVVIQRDEIKLEKDHYRTVAHDKRNEAQALALHIKELEARPDFATLATNISENTRVLGSLAEAIRERDKMMEEIFAKLTARLV